MGGLKKRKGRSRLLSVISCVNVKGPRSDSRKEFGEILNSRLATIMEEDEMQEDDAVSRTPTKAGLRRWAKVGGGGKSRWGRRPLASFGDMYVNLMVGFASRGSMVELKRL